MKVLVSSLGQRSETRPGVRQSPADGLQQLLELAQLSEELGFDAFGIGERHNSPFFTSSPPVILSAIAQVTRTIELYTTVTVISQLDPLRAAEDYATLGQLSGGRLSLIVGRGQEYDRYAHFGQEYERQWDYTEERTILLRRLLRERDVTWSGWSRPPLSNITISPQPSQPEIPIWHGSISSERTRRLAADLGDPFFIVNGFLGFDTYRFAVDEFRRLWQERGRNPADAVVGAGNAIFYIAERTQDALREAKPYFVPEVREVNNVRETGETYLSLEEAAGPKGVALVGSPNQIFERIAEQQQAYGNTTVTIGVTPFSRDVARKNIELFASTILPAVQKL